MIENLNKFYTDMQEASILGRNIKIQDYDKIVFCGIGGSAVPGEIVKSLNLDKPVLIAREKLPKCADKKSLCFIISYSGNTNETIDLYKQAKRKRCKIVIISSGGKLSKLKGEKVSIPVGYLPREAFIYLILPVLNILKIKYRDCFKIIRKFDLNLSKEIARKLKNKIPVIYSSSEDLRFLGYIWQTFFNENCKIFAHENYFPELAHNEILAKNTKKNKVILLIDKETKQIKKAKKFFNSIEIRLKGRTLPCKMIYGLYLGFVTSYFLAEMSGTNYKEMRKISELKK